MQYDALHRLTQKNYSDGTPTAAYGHDQSSAYGVTLLNTTGRMSSESTNSPNPTGSIFSYDQLGRVKINSQCTPQNCSSNTVFPVTYTYDLLGDTLTSTNGTGVTLTFSFNIAPRLTTLNSSLSDSNHPGTLLSAAHYNPAGSLHSVTLGGTVSETRTYDARLRLASISDGSNYSLTIPSSGGYSPSGNILAANDSANGNWTYTYDDFNRLLTANATGQPYTYDYDRYGNRWHQNGPHSSQLGFDANNHMTGVTGVTYDLSGNLTGDGTHKYFLDAENRIIQVDGTLGTCSTATACYLYNAEGKRVRKTTGTNSVDYLYDTSSNQITELSSSAAWNRGEVYGSGRHIATYANGTTNLIHVDWLGTERVRTNASGASCETITSLPFGDGQTISGSCGDPSPLHFTSKERDSETGLDNFGARYNSSSFGRFTSPDPLSFVGLPIDTQDPQSWNAYSYVRNSSLNLTDPDGTIFCRPPNETEKGVSQVCDVTDAQYVNSSKEQRAAYDKAGYKHYDCNCDSGADKDAWQHPNGNVGRDYVGYALVFAASVAIVRHVTSYFLDEADEEEETVAIGKMEDLEKPGALKPGEKTLDLPDQGSAKANWAQNSSKLREAMSEGKPIRDVSVNNPKGETGFLRAERNLLRDHGWELKGDTWYPPNK